MSSLSNFLLRFFFSLILFFLVIAQQQLKGPSLSLSLSLSLSHGPWAMGMCLTSRAFNLHFNSCHVSQLIILWRRKSSSLSLSLSLWKESKQYKNKEKKKEILVEKRRVYIKHKIYLSFRSPFFHYLSILFTCILNAVPLAHVKPKRTHTHTNLTLQLLCVCKPYLSSNCSGLL